MTVGQTVAGVANDQSILHGTLARSVSCWRWIETAHRGYRRRRVFHARYVYLDWVP